MGVLKRTRFKEGSYVQVLFGRSYGARGTVEIRPQNLSERSTIAIRMDGDDDQTLKYFTPEMLMEVEELEGHEGREL
jgi:hypothetical protein